MKQLGVNSESSVHSSLLQVFLHENNFSFHIILIIMFKFKNENTTFCYTKLFKINFGSKVSARCFSVTLEFFGTNKGWERGGYSEVN